MNSPVQTILSASLVQLLLITIAYSKEASKELPTAIPEAVGMSSAKLALVDQQMQSYVDNGEMVGGIVLIARHGKVCFFEDYGLADRENGRAMSKDSILRFYSMTKSITTTAALMLYDEGKLDVNAPVARYLPALNQLNVLQGEGVEPAQTQMTVADLMRHTSGLTYGDSSSALLNELFKENDPLDPNMPLSEMPERLRQVPLLFEPGKKWKYGISTDVLGCVVEAVSGQTLGEFLSEQIFVPLDMRDTEFSVPEAKRHRFAACYESKDGAIELKADENEKYLTPPTFESGGGGLVSTARDYMRFLMMIERGGELAGRRYLKPETVLLMTTNQVSEEAGWIGFGDDVQEGVGFSFGFSVRVEKSDFDPARPVGEYGWGGAASTHYWISPADELIVITLEQMFPYRDLIESGLKQLIYDAIED